MKDLILSIIGAIFFAGSAVVSHKVAHITTCPIVMEYIAVMLAIMAVVYILFGVIEYSSK